LAAVAGGEEAEARKKALAGLTRATGVLRREVTERAALRFAPELKFFYDEVPLSVHERVQDHCMDRRWNKRIPMYKVINTAITEMLIHLQESNERTNQPD
jgi:hypothetical protein